MPFGSIAMPLAFAAQDKFCVQQGDRQLHIPSRMFPCFCTCGVMFVPVTATFNSFYALSKTNSAAGVCTYLATCLCARKNFFVVLIDVLSSCLLPSSCTSGVLDLSSCSRFCSAIPPPSSLYIHMGWGCIGALATHSWSV